MDKKRILEILEGAKDDNGEIPMSLVRKAFEKIEEPCANTVRLQENELYQELTLHVGDTQIGEAEVDLKNKMISRLVIYDPEQNKGYGTEIVKQLIDKYGCDCLWVVADNDKAIHVYEKQGFKKVKPTMYLMER